MTGHRADNPTAAAAAALALALTSLLFGTPQLAAQASQVRVAAEEIDCLPIEDNGVGWARVENNRPDATVRLNFRRLNDTVEDLYWTPMRPAGDGRYWGVFPKAGDFPLNRHELFAKRAAAQQEYGWAEWWREKEQIASRDPNDDLDADLIRERASLGKEVPREWLAEMDNETFQQWLEQLENEPAEYFTSVHDAQGNQIARSKTRVTEVRRNCRVDMTPEQRGEAENLIIGETAYWQRGEEIFHWLCPGVVTRVDPTGVKRGDEICRACVIAWYDKVAFFVPAIVPPLLKDHDDERSPVLP